MKNKKKIWFWLFYHVGLLIFSALSAMWIKYNQTGSAFVPETILVFSTVFIMSAVTGYLAIFMVNKGKTLSHEKLTKRVVPYFLIFLISVVIIANLTVSLGVFVWFLVIGRDIGEFFPHLFKYELHFSNSSLYTWLMFFSIAFFYILWRKSANKQQQLIREKLKYQYNNLKAQVNPHFLFNSLNTLSELVYQDTKKADGYIQKLSSIYRYILENENVEIIPLDKELNFVRDYFELQKVRDDDKIRLNLNVKESENLKITPVSLQILIENALKHNARSKEKPLLIEIKLVEETLIVSNNLQRKNATEVSTGLGLNNLKERIKLSMNKELISFEKEGKFIVKLPVSK